MPHQWGTDWAIGYLKWYETKKQFIYRTPGVNEVDYYKKEVSQMATYWFVIDWLDIQKAQKSKV